MVKLWLLIVFSLKLVSSDLRSTINDLRRETWSQNRNIQRQNAVLMRAVRQITDDLEEIKKIFVNQTVPSKSSCLDLHRSNSSAPSGVYLIELDGGTKAVYCEMERFGGGWMRIQKRFNGDEEFYRSFHDYRQGFGNIAAEHWIGLELLHKLTDGTLNELLIELEADNGTIAYAQYDLFMIGSEAEGYRLKVLGDYQGSAGDSFRYHGGAKFSTKDHDQDDWDDGNCATSHHGAGWYKSCDRTNLNGRYLVGPQEDILQYQSMYWETFRGSLVGLKSSEMLIRPRATL